MIDAPFVPLHPRLIGRRLSSAFGRAIGKEFGILDLCAVYL